MNKLNTETSLLWCNNFQLHLTIPPAIFNIISETNRNKASCFLFSIGKAREMETTFWSAWISFLLCLFFLCIESAIHLLSRASLAHLTSFFWCCFVAMVSKCYSMHQSTVCAEQLSVFSLPSPAKTAAPSWGCYGSPNQTEFTKLEQAAWMSSKLNNLPRYLPTWS